MKKFNCITLSMLTLLIALPVSAAEFFSTPSAGTMDFQPLVEQQFEKELMRDRDSQAKDEDLQRKVNTHWFSRRIRNDVKQNSVGSPNAMRFTKDANGNITIEEIR